LENGIDFAKDRAKLAALLMGIKFHSRLNERGDELFVLARGEDRPNIIAEVTGFLEAEGLYVASISFNLTSPEQDQFSMEIVARGPERKLEKCSLALDAAWPLGKTEEEKQWPKIRWTRAWMFHVGLNTPDRAGLVAAISRAVGRGQSEKSGGNRMAAGSFVHLLGAIENSGDSAEGGTPYFVLRANVATETRAERDEIIARLQRAAKEQGFGGDLWAVALDQVGSAQS
jgi:predicted amino acid-binding ACT domain protein